jgi:hypothetical protein
MDTLETYQCQQAKTLPHTHLALYNKAVVDRTYVRVDIDRGIMLLIP